MLNQTGIKKETYQNVPQILFNVEHQVSLGIVVSDAYSIQRAGRKIVPAGTPMTGTLDERTTAFTKSESGTDAVGVLLHDVDVTAGEANGTLLIFGFVNKNRIDETTLALINTEAEKAMPMIKFVKC